MKTRNPRQIELVSDFLENLKLQDDDLLPMQEVRKKWDVLNKKREADLKTFTETKRRIQHWKKKMKFYEKEVKCADKELAKLKGPMYA